MLEPHAGYFAHEKVSAIRYQQPVLSGEGQDFYPRGHWTPRIDPDNVAYYSLYSEFSKSRFLSPRLPIDMGYWDTGDITSSDVPNVLRMPIKTPGSNYRIPKELSVLMPMIKRIAEYEAFISPSHEQVYAHITFDHSKVLAGQTHRFPGFHGDGFQGTKLTPKIIAEHSYILCTSPPTEFCIQPFFLNHLDDAKHNMFNEFDKQAKKQNIYRSIPRHLYLIDPYMVHRTPQIPDDTWRMFIRLTYTYAELDHPGNTVNPMFPDQKYPDRHDIRGGLSEFEFEIPYHLYGIQQ